MSLQKELTRNFGKLKEFFPELYVGTDLQGYAFPRFYFSGENLNGSE
jgi:hypothetical protein